jgi:hypothetical protein
MAERDELIDDEIAERELLEQPPDFDRKMPAQMSVTQFDRWCALGKPPTAPMRRQAASRNEDELRDMAEKFSKRVDSLPPSPATERLQPCTCPSCQGRMVPVGTPVLHATRDVMRRWIAEAKKELRTEFRRELRAAKRAALDEARAEIRRSMDADDTVIHLTELRRHG